MPYVKEVSDVLVRFASISELLGGLGFLLPVLLRFNPILTSLAVFGLFIVMFFAFVYHVTKGEYQVLGFIVILGAIAFFIAWSGIKNAISQKI